MIGTIAATTGIVPFAELVTQVMTTEPYASAHRVFWIVDNGSSHAGQASIDRMKRPGRPPSWSTCPSMRPGSTRSRSTSRSCNARPSPPATSPTSTTWPPVLGLPRPLQRHRKLFDWRYTRNDLNNYLARLRRHDHESTPKPHEPPTNQRK